jgi:uncharacterized oxidoreductase
MQAMKLQGNTVLVTGGASGIGLALATRFLNAGSEVLICGRREDKLHEATAHHPQLKSFVCDVASAAGRTELVRWCTSEFPHLNVVVLNAGIQHRIDLAQAAWPQAEQEIAINLAAPLHLAMLLIPHLLRQTDPVLINVTSGLSFSPLARVPIYSATKAGLHSFTLSLRHQLEATPIEVVEIIPPAVNTDLGGPGLHTFGVALDAFADHVMGRLASGEAEITYGFSEQASRASRAELDEIFRRMNAAEH